MRRLDFQTNVIKNPVSGDNPATNLARKWRNRVFYVKGWVRTFSFALLGIVYLVGISIWQYYAKDNGSWNQTGLYETRSVVLLIVWFLIIRFHLFVFPALVICSDTKESLWEHFRMTLITGDDVAKAMFYNALNLGAIPLAIVSTPPTIYYMLYANPLVNFWGTLIYVPVIFIIYMILGLAMSALGYIGALIWRHPMGVFGGVLIPVVIALLSAGADFIRDFIGIFSAHIPYSLGDQPVTLFLAMENRIAFSGSSISRHGFTTIAGVDLMGVINIAIQLGIIAAVLWIALWIVLRYRLRRG